MDWSVALFPSVKLECLKNKRRQDFTQITHSSVIQLSHYVKGTVLCELKKMYS